MSATFLIYNLLFLSDSLRYTFILYKSYTTPVLELYNIYLISNYISSSGMVSVFCVI